MTTELQQRIARVEAECRAVIELAGKATAGPWSAFQAMSSICVGGNEPIERIEDMGKLMYVEVFGENKEGNATFIAISRTACPKMARAVLTAIDFIKETSAQSKEFCCHADRATGWLTTICDEWEAAV